MWYLLLCLLPAVFAAPSNLERESNDKRFIQSLLGFDVGSVFDLTALKCDVQILLDQFATDPSEASCESECHVLVKEGHVLNYGCPLVCHALQNLAHYFHETPKPGDQNMPCGGLASGK